MRDKKKEKTRGGEGGTLPPTGLYLSDGPLSAGQIDPGNKGSFPLPVYLFTAHCHQSETHTHTHTYDPAVPSES